MRCQLPARASGESWKTRIRKAGKEIGHAGRKDGQGGKESACKSSLERHRYSLIVSIVLLITLVIVIGHMLSRMVARPLRTWKKAWRPWPMAAGTRSTFLATEDREMVSLTNAFNHVLQELELRQKHLVRSEKLASLGTLLSGVAHELNNPLSNISTSCQILTRGTGERRILEFKREMLEQIDEQTMRARNIVRSLLDFARDREFNREPLPLADLISRNPAFHQRAGAVPCRDCHRTFRPISKFRATSSVCSRCF